MISNTNSSSSLDQDCGILFAYAFIYLQVSNALLFPFAISACFHFSTGIPKNEEIEKRDVCKKKKIRSAQRRVCICVRPERSGCVLARYKWIESPEENPSSSSCLRLGIYQGLIALGPLLAFGAQFVARPASNLWYISFSPL